VAPNSCIARARRSRAGFRKFPKISEISMHRARVARLRGFDSLPSLSDVGPRFILLLQAEVSKRFYSSKAKGFNVHYFAALIGTVVALA
jgi:hypothetical protein